MKKKTATAKRRRRLLPLALMGVLLGMGLACALVRRQQRLMPWAALNRHDNDLSIYEVSGEVSGDWPLFASATEDAPTDVAERRLRGPEPGLTAPES